MPHSTGSMQHRETGQAVARLLADLEVLRRIERRLAQTDTRGRSIVARAVPPAQTPGTAQRTTARS